MSIQPRRANVKLLQTPRISRAEQLRREREEQQRVREENAQRIARERAQAARKRKKEKEEEKRQGRKKQGLPSVDARPSQDTIARFVWIRPPDRGKGKTLAATLEGMEGDGEPGVAESDDAKHVAAPRKPCANNHISVLAGNRRSGSQSHHRPVAASPLPGSNAVEPPLKRPKSEGIEPTEQARTSVGPCSRAREGNHLGIRSNAGNFFDKQEDRLPLFGLCPSGAMAQEFEDLFLSATQLAREMEEENKKGTKEHRKDESEMEEKQSTWGLEAGLSRLSETSIGTTEAGNPMRPEAKPLEIPFFCTQDFDFTLEDLLEIGDACPQETKDSCHQADALVQTTLPRPRPPSLAYLHSSVRNQQAQSADLVTLCSQDLMSTQDLLEIEGAAPLTCYATSASTKNTVPGPTNRIMGCNKAHEETPSPPTPPPEADATNVLIKMAAPPGADASEDSDAEPERFFTASGTQELIALAMMRSRQTAAQEERARRQAKLRASASAACKSAVLSSVSPNRARQPVRNAEAARFKGNYPRKTAASITRHADGSTNAARDSCQEPSTRTIPREESKLTTPPKAWEDEYGWGGIDDEDWDLALAQCQPTTHLL